MVDTCTFHGVWKIVLVNWLTCLMILKQINQANTILVRSVIIVNGTIERTLKVLAGLG